MRSYLALSMVFIFAGYGLGHAASTEAIHEFTNAVATEQLVYAIEKPVRIGDSKMLMIEAMKKIMEELPKSHKPVSELMNAKQANEFGQLEQKHKYFNLLSLMYSKRVRDLNVTEKLVFLANQEYQWGNTPEKGDKDYDYYVLLIGIRSNPKDDLAEYDAIKPFDKISKSLLGKLFTTASSDFGRIAEEAEKFANEIKEKYKTSKIEDHLLTEDEKAKKNELRNSTSKAYKYVASIIKIYGYYCIATNENELGIKDLMESGGDSSAVGKSFQAFAAKNYSTPSLEFICKFSTFVNEKMPAPIIKEWEEAQNAVAKIEDHERKADIEDNKKK